MAIPYLLKDIVPIAKEYILRDYSHYTSDYKSRLISECFATSYNVFFELQDIIFAIKSLKSPSESFDTNNRSYFLFNS